MSAIQAARSWAVIGCKKKSVFSLNSISASGAPTIAAAHFSACVYACDTFPAIVAITDVSAPRWSRADSAVICVLGVIS
jgi:hypothetical protein